MSKLLGRGDRTPSVETLEYQKIFRSKYESFPKIFFSFCHPGLLSCLPHSLSLALLLLPFIPFSFLPLSFLSLSHFFFPLYPSSLGRKLVNGVSIICIFSITFSGGFSTYGCLRTADVE